MSGTYKARTGLGLTLAVMSSVVGACEGPNAPGSQSAAGEASGAVDVAAAPVSLATAGGEGEGGISLDQAATDPVIYGAALAVTEAHVLAARDAFALGENEAAVEMFAHPVSEVLAELEDLFNERGVPLFDGLLLEASQAVLTGESADQISRRVDEIVAALRVAAAGAPEAGRSAISVRAAVAADQADRAAAMYRIAKQAGTYEPYLDGYGFYKAGLALFEERRADILAADPAAAAALAEAFAELGGAYPDAGRQVELNADVSAITVAASAAVLATSH